MTLILRSSHGLAGARFFARQAASGRQFDRIVFAPFAMASWSASAPSPSPLSLNEEK